MKVKFALIGCGRISVNHLDAIKNVPIAELVAVCDLNEEKAKKAALKNGLKTWYTDMDEMIEAEKPDVCCVLTPSGMHADHVIRVAKHGVHVLCEKPIDVKKEKMDAMIEACKEHHVKLGCIFQRRTFSAVVETAKAVREGALGTVTLGSAYLKYYRDQKYYDSGDWRGTWELDGGGALMNQGIHGVDMLNFMMGGVKSVKAYCERLAWDIDVEDTAVVMVKFKNGAIGVIECATTVYPGLDTVFSINGTKGSISFGDRGFSHFKIKDDSYSQPEVTGSLGGMNCGYGDNNRGHILQIEDMANAVLEDRDPMVTGEDARESVKIILAIYESAKTGKEIFM